MKILNLSKLTIKPLLASLSLLVTVPIFAAVSPALAQTTGACLLNPNDNNCNNKDPGIEGCETDARTPSDPNSSVKIFDNNFNEIGKVTVRYSPACKSSWARVVIRGPLCPGSLFAQVQRDGDFKSFFNATSVFPNPSTGECNLRSPMIYSPKPFNVLAAGGLLNSPFMRNTPFINPRQ
jgi:hypothetical protein